MEMVVHSKITDRSNFFFDAVCIYCGGNRIMKLVSAYKVSQVMGYDDQYGRVVAIVYRDDYDRRCTMFVTTGTDPGVQVLIDLINGVGSSDVLG